MSDPLRKPSDAVGDSGQHPPMTEAGGSTPGLSKGPMATRRSLSGLTLIELLIAVAVLTVVVMLAYPYYIGIVARARETAAVAHMSDWPKAQLLYWIDRGHFATSLTQLYDAGFLVPVDSNRIGYSFEITQFTAAAPPRGRTMPAFAAAPADTWWEGIGLIRHAWAGDDDDEDEKDKKDKDKKNKKKDNENKGKDREDKNGDDDKDESSTAGKGGWAGYADPTDERPRHFYTDHTNEVRFANGRRATRYDPVFKHEDKYKDKRKDDGKDDNNDDSNDGINNSGSNSGKGRGGL